MQKANNNMVINQRFGVKLSFLYVPKYYNAWQSFYFLDVVEAT